MFGKRVTLFKLLGFAVRVDVSWLIIAALITWSLATGVFPHYFGGLGEATYWWMGVVGTLGLFASIVVHELSHSLVARRFGLPMRGITLFIFGGVAEMDDEPPSAKAELFMALAGPAVSIVIGVAGVAAYSVMRQSWPVEVAAIVAYLGWINLVLAAFNLLPAFPLDGGRAFRAILWWSKGDLGWATRIASAIGSGFGFLLMFLGIYYVIRGAFVGGIWWLLIGMFVRSASQGSYRQLVVRGALEGEPVSRFMRRDPVTVPPSLAVDRLVEDVVYHHHFKMYPVVDHDRLVGCVTTKEIKQLARESWPDHQVRELALACSGDNTVAPDADAAGVLATMSRTGNSRLMVVEDGRLVGVVSLKDLLEFISTKLDLEGRSVPSSMRRS